MPSPYDTFNTKSTSISYPWPAGVSGIERIALSAQGDLQRVLSAFFSRPINIALVYSQTLRQPGPNCSSEPLTLPNPQAIASVTPSCPITQTRQVHLQCGGKIACTATSIVRITTPEVARLFLEDQYPIGQMFRRMGRPPTFELLNVGFGPVVIDDEKAQIFQQGFQTGDNNQIWRRYKLVIPDFECEILEVFPCRKMFVDGEAWLNGKELAAPKQSPKTMDINFTLTLSRDKGNVLSVLLLALFFLVAFEGALFALGRSVNCTH